MPKKTRIPTRNYFPSLILMSTQEGMKDYEAAKKTCSEAIDLKKQDECF
jgi:hypothetical protein